MLHRLQHVASTAWSTTAAGASAITTAFLLTDEGLKKGTLLILNFLDELNCQTFNCHILQFNNVKYSHIAVQ